MRLRVGVFFAHIDQSDFAFLQKCVAHFQKGGDVKAARQVFQRVAIARNEFFDRAVFVENVAAHFADIGAIHMDADGGVVVQSIPNAVHIADMGGDGLDFAYFQTFLGIAGEPMSLCVFHKRLAQLGAA